MSAVGIPVASRRAPRTARALLFGLAATAALLLAAFVASNVVALVAQRNLASRWEAALADPEAHMHPAPGDPVARIRVPGTSLDVVVAEGGSPSRAPVHLPGTALPGFPGMAAVEGGRIGFGSFFAAIGRLEPGDEVVVQSLNGIVRYHVLDVQELLPSSIDLSSGGDATMLALIAPASHLGSAERIVVRARADAETGS